jgi:ABC-2 type transport system permease protein
MPAAIRAITLLVYPRYYVSILRAVFLKGSGVADLAFPLAALSLYAAFIIWVAARAFRKSLD